MFKLCCLATVSNVDPLTIAAAKLSTETVSVSTEYVSGRGK